MDRPDTTALATGYTTLNATQTATSRFLLTHLSISPGARILDIGCGPGDITQHLLSLTGPSGLVVGIDPSAERIALAQKLIDSNPGAAGNLSFHRGIAEDLSRWGDESFDVVFVNSTLHWVADQPLAIREFARVLRRGGKLGVSGGSGDFSAVHEQIKERVLSMPEFVMYPETGGPRFLKKVEMEELLDKAGFGERSIVVNRIVKEAKGPDDMIDWLDTSSSGQTYGGIPVELRPKAREEMRREWQGYVESDGGIKMDMELLVTVAVKA